MAMMVVFRFLLDVRVTVPPLAIVGLDVVGLDPSVV